MHGEGVIPFLLIFLSDALCLLSPLLSGSLLRDKFVNRNLQVPRELVVVVNDILRTEGVVEPTVAEAVLDHLLQIAGNPSGTTPEDRRRSLRHQARGPSAWSPLRFSGQSGSCGGLTACGRDKVRSKMQR